MVGDDVTGSAFRGRPWRVLAALATMVALAGLISGWNIGYRGFPPYYSDAVRSMSESWRAFFFGSFDPAATITLDKLAGFLIPQALSVRIFGFHAWSMALPQVIEGMVTVGAAFVVGTRWNGSMCGLTCAAAITFTPLLAAMFGRGSEDCLLTMSLTMAFLCWQSAILGGRLRLLMLAAAWIGIGFQAKMMQAWFILPGLGVGYVLGAPHPLVVRVRRALLAGVVVAVVSLSWVTAIQLVPATNRPYIDGTTNNNAFTMVFGYNGFNRIVPHLVPGSVGNLSLSAVPAGPRHPVATEPTPVGVDAAIARTALGESAQSRTGRPALRRVSVVAAALRWKVNTGTLIAQAPPPEPIPVPASATNLVITAEHSHAKLVIPFFDTQIGWLYPLALGGIALGLQPLWARRRSLYPRRLRRRGAAAAPAAPVPPVDPLDRGDVRSAAGGHAELAVADPAVVVPSGGMPSGVMPRSVDPSVATTIALTVWLLTAAAFLSVITIPHTVYLAAVSVQIALLASFALTRALQLRAERVPAGRWVLALIIGLEIGWTCAVLLTNAAAPKGIAPIVAVLGVGSVVLLTRFGRSTSRPRLAWIGVAAAVVATFLTPVLYSGFVVTKSDPVHYDPYAGPTPGAAQTAAAAKSGRPSERTFTVRAPFTVPANPHLGAVQATLVAFLRDHPGPDGPMMATDRWAAAEPYIELGGLEVVTFGGFSGRLATPTAAHLRSMVASGELRYVLLHIPGSADLRTPIGVEVGGGGFGRFEGNDALKLGNWVSAHCAPMAAATYLGPRQALPGQRLYDCGQ